MHDASLCYVRASHAEGNTKLRSTVVTRAKHHGSRITQEGFTSNNSFVGTVPQAPSTKLYCFACNRRQNLLLMCWSAKYIFVRLLTRVKKPECSAVGSASVLGTCDVKTKQ